jgi:hypothetical protein
MNAARTPRYVALWIDERIDQGPSLIVDDRYLNNPVARYWGKTCRFGIQIDKHACSAVTRLAIEPSDIGTTVSPMPAYAAV